MSASPIPQFLMSQLPALQAQTSPPQTSPPQGLILRDIHQPPPPPWWPPAPGWWLVAVVLAAAALMYFGRRFLYRRYVRRCERMFDDAVAAASPGPARIAAISEMLRRAARRRDPAADRLEGEAWLRFLDAAGDDAIRTFTDGPGRTLLDGAFRPAVSPAELDALHALARMRFLDLMQARR